jgi:Mrp family chromosome partitioning ATPase
VAAVLIALGLVIAAAWAVVKSPSYQSTARILVSPLPQDDTTFIGLPLIRDSGDSTTTMQTVATLIDSNQAAQLTAATLGPGWSSRRVQAAVNVQPEGQSQILDVTATASSARTAALLANRFAATSLAIRARQLRRQVGPVIASTSAQLAGAHDPASVAAADLQDKLNQLLPLRNGTDPTIVLAQRGVVPRSPSGLRKPLIIVLGLIAGFAMASVAVLGLELIRRPRVFEEQEVKAIVSAPVVGRIPVQRRRKRLGALRSPLPRTVSEALRGAVIQLEVLGGRHQSILVTSASHGDGRTTTTVNLGRELAQSGGRVLIVDLDLGKPSLASVFGVEPAAKLPVALEAADPFSYARETEAESRLYVLPAWPDPEFRSLGRVAEALPGALERIAEEVDYVVLDAPPLGEVTAVLRFLRCVDDVLLVSRLGHTPRASLDVAQERFDRAGRRPNGHIIIGRLRRHSTPVQQTHGEAGSRSFDVELEQNGRLGPRSRLQVP